VPIWRQERRMSELERDAFLDRFHPEGRGIGFAVLGGSFGEGIDLPGARLIGAFVATLGLPQINPVNEQLRTRMQAMFGAGYDYTYLYPGLQKVVQAAGRVIRTELDQAGGLPDRRPLRPARGARAAAALVAGRETQRMIRFLDLLVAAAADRHPLAVLQHRAPAVLARRSMRLDRAHVHDVGTVHAQEQRRIELAARVPPCAVLQVQAPARADLHIIVLRLDPVDLAVGTTCTRAPSRIRIR
jgi:hypothetical protein